MEVKTFFLTSPIFSEKQDSADVKTFFFFGLHQFLVVIGNLTAARLFFGVVRW